MYIVVKTIITKVRWTKRAARNKHNSHESKMVPTTNFILTQRQVGWW